MSTRSERQPPSQGYSCPYRKFNPDHFNENDYLECARSSFRTIQDVKQHIAIFHRQSANSCVNCAEPFATEQELTAHLSLPTEQLCTFMTPGEEMMFGGYERLVTPKWESWRSLWAKLFGRAERPKSPAFREP